MISYETIGSIAVMKKQGRIKDAREILKSNKNITTVVTRKGDVSGGYRIKGVKHVSGIKTTETIHKENNCRFKIDINKEYYSPRLQTERQRVIEQVGEHDTIIDMFAGVGPFAIPIAKKARRVFTIDYNPKAVEHMLENMKLNKVNNIIAYEGDSLKVINKLPGADKIIMNAPRQNNQETLDVAVRNLNDKGVIYYYISEDRMNKIDYKGLTLVNKRRVIDYAPGKSHYCIELIKE